jgi:DNA polymerase I-like protein with 3'-5' exonuclease and polymerase domains
MMQTPLFKPQTEWTPPTEFPNLSKYKEIAIDLETKDPNLLKMGSGAITGNGEIVGISVAVENWSGYFPIAHAGGGNLDKNLVLNWFREVLKTDAIKIFHNAMYDICWIKTLSNITIGGQIVDTMIAAALVNENRMRYDLNSLSRDYLGEGKNESALQEAAKEWGLDAKSEMYKLPALYVGSYAEKDAELTLALWQEMKKEIEHQDIHSIFELETQLFPALIDMRFLGVRVNQEQALIEKKILVEQEKKELLEIKKETDINVQIWAARSIAQVFDKLKLPYDRTEKTKAPSFTKNFLSNHPHPLVKRVARAREINKAHTTFIDTILKHTFKGRIYAEINQLRGDGGGTVTGRFSYSNPNLQQVPARNKDLGPRIRSLFIPEEGCQWGVFDYNQQEPRLVVHYATLQNLSGIDEVLEAYKKGEADFHSIVSEMADIPRTQAKTINLGLFYGMGKNKLQAELGINKERADELFKQYHHRVPFVKQLMNAVMQRAQFSGKIRTLLGRLCRFHLWEPNQFGIHKALPHEAALAEHGPGIRRAYTYKALNKLIQGSAADMTKKAMINLHKEGIIPHIQIHDELDISIHDQKQANKIKEIMEDVITLEVPNKVDYECGPNWGNIK